MNNIDGVHKFCDNLDTPKPKKKVKGIWLACSSFLVGFSLLSIILLVPLWDGRNGLDIIGDMISGVEKQTVVVGDADIVTYYFDDYDAGEAWANNPANMKDGNTGNYANSGANTVTQLLDENSCDGTNLGTITKVEIRAFGYFTKVLDSPTLYLRPVFTGGDGTNHNTGILEGVGNTGWCSWIDITTDDNAPSWTWNAVDGLDCDVYNVAQTLSDTFVSKVEVQVTYTPSVANAPPTSSNEAPTNNSDCVSWVGGGITTYAVVTDPDGDDMNITWWSNSSGSWEQYGIANTSVSNNTNISMQNANFTTGDTWYHWWMLIDDGENGACNDSYRFKILWWNNSWDYFKTCSISNKRLGYQMKILVDNSTGNGNVSCDSHAQPDFDDIRFLRIDNNTLLDYWIETVTDNDQAIIWVNNTYNDSTILIYYGNDAVANTSNGTNTFYMWDDFDNGYNDGDVPKSSRGWVVTDKDTGDICNIEVSPPAGLGNGNALRFFTGTGANLMLLDNYFYQLNSTIVHFDWHHVTRVSQFRCDVKDFDDEYSAVASYTKDVYSWEFRSYDGGGSSWNSYSPAFTPSEDTWYDIEYVAYYNDHDLIIDDNLKSGYMYKLGDGFDGVRMYSNLNPSNGDDWYIDNFYVRNYTAGVKPSWIEEEVWTNSNPVVSSPNPPDTQIDVELSLANYYNHFNISVVDLNEANQSINVTWRTNESGNWLDMGWNESTTCNSTFYCTNVSWIDTTNTKYWWSVNVSDNHSTKGWDNETYSFTTSLPPTSPTTLTAGNATTSTINLSWMRGMYTNDSLRPYVDDGSYSMLYLSDIQNPAGIQYDNVTYILHTDSNGDIDASYYNHSTQIWVTGIDVGANPDIDEHGCPAFNYNATGYFHAFWGAHNDPFEYAISDNPFDVTSWTAQSDIGADGNTYPVVVRLDNGSLLLFYRHLATPAEDYPINYRTEWGDFGDSTEKTLVDWASLNRIYPFSFILNDDGTRIYFIYTWHDYTDAKRHNIYCAYLLLSNFTCYNMTDHYLGTTIDETESRTYCEVHNSTTHTLNTMTMDLDGNDNPYIIYNYDGISINFTYWTGSTWTTPTVITYCDHTFDSTDLLVHSSTDIEVYLPTNGTLQLPTRGGNMERWDWNGTAWSRDRWILNASVSGRPLYAPQIIYNYTDDMKLIFSEWNDTTSTDDLKGYLSGDSGILGLSPIYTRVRYSKSDNLTSRTDGSQAYNNTSSTFSLTGLDSDTTYWFRAWSYSPNGGWNSIGSNTVSLATTEAWHLVENWNFSFSNTSQHYLTEIWNFSFSNTTRDVWTLVENWNFSFSNSTQHYLTELWNFSFSNTSEQWKLVESWDFSFSNTSTHILIESWNFSFSNTTRDIWTLVESWNFSFSNTSSYVLTEVWNFSFSNTSEQWKLVESWDFSFSNTSQYNLMEVWNFSFSNTSEAWHLVENWNFSFSNTTQYYLTESWNFSFSNTSREWTLVDSWDFSFGNSTQHYLTEVWNFSFSNTSEDWHLVENWNFSFSNTSSHVLTEVWNFSFSNISKEWILVDSWNFSFGNTTQHSLIEVWNFSFSNTTGDIWNLVEVWNFSFSNTSEVWNLVESWNFSFGNSSIIAITISNIYPGNLSINIGIQPYLYATFNSTTGNTLNISWYYNGTLLATEINSTNGTYNELLFEATERLTNYTWEVKINDGHGNWLNNSYSFTTESLGGGGFNRRILDPFALMGIMIGVLCIFLIFLFSSKKKRGENEWEYQ